MYRSRKVVFEHMLIKESPNQPARPFCLIKAFSSLCKREMPLLKRLHGCASPPGPCLPHIQEDLIFDVAGSYCNKTSCDITKFFSRTFTNSRNTDQSANGPIHKHIGSGQRRSWSDCADAQSDLGLRFPHMHRAGWSGPSLYAYAAEACFPMLRLKTIH